MLTFLISLEFILVEIKKLYRVKGRFFLELLEAPIKKCERGDSHLNII